MRSHPYRSEADAEPLAVEALECFEERAVAFVLMAAGTLGLVIGLDSPKANATELVFGFIVAGLGLGTLLRRGERRVV